MTHHLVTLRFASPQPLCPDESAALYLARAVSRVGGEHGLVAWRATERRLAMLVCSDHRSAGQAARRIAIGAQQVLGDGSRFHPASIEPVHGRDRVRDLHDSLLLGGSLESRMTASSLPDALGMRALAPYLQGSLFECTALPDLVRPQPLPLHSVADWSCLARAAAAVWGWQDLGRRSAWRASALSAAAGLAFPALSPRRLATLLGVSLSTVQRALGRRASPVAKAMVERQLRWRSRARLSAGQERRTVTMRPSP